MEGCRRRGLPATGSVTAHQNMIRNKPSRNSVESVQTLFWVQLGYNLPRTQGQMDGQCPRTAGHLAATPGTMVRLLACFLALSCNSAWDQQNRAGFTVVHTARSPDVSSDSAGARLCKQPFPAESPAISSRLKALKLGPC